MRASFLARQERKGREGKVSVMGNMILFESDLFKSVRLVQFCEKQSQNPLATFAV